MASLPGLTALLLARIPSEAKGDTVRSFIESVEPRDSEALDLASVKLGLELLRACPNVSSSSYYGIDFRHGLVQF
jgi:hypothetical protein